jgi:hypothetical protein
MGFGIAVALALDATLVRLLLIPAAMRLLGERNWYLPRWLVWLPDLQVEGAHQPQASPADAPHDPPKIPPDVVAGRLMSAQAGPISHDSARTPPSSDALTVGAGSQWPPRSASPR